MKEDSKWKDTRINIITEAKMHIFNSLKQEIWYKKPENFIVSLFILRPDGGLTKPDHVRWKFGNIS